MVAEKESESETPPIPRARPKPRPIVQLGIFLISHSLLFRYSSLFPLSHIYYFFKFHKISITLHQNPIRHQQAQISDRLAVVFLFLQCRFLHSWGSGSFAASGSRQEHLHLRECPYARSALHLQSLSASDSFTFVCVICSIINMVLLLRVQLLTYQALWLLCSPIRRLQRLIDWSRI